MHENREISSAPPVIDEGRSVKAHSRTTDTHALEKSDCAVLPVNRPNKGGQPPAEAGEGRAQMKENIDQPHMLPTQRGKGMVCPRGWTVCVKQQGKGNGNGSPLCSTISTSIFFAIAFTLSSVRLRRESMA